MQIDTENLAGLSLADLEEARRKLDKAISGFQARKEKETAERIEQILRESGADRGNVLGIVGKKAGVKAAPKFRHRDDPSKVWTGRGRKPGWLDEHGVAVE
jgi:DNA-binding protein H-NS